MFWTKLNESTRTLLYCVTVVALLVAGLIYVAGMSTAEASPPTSANLQSAQTAVVPAVTFPANAGSLGQIPDSPAGGNLCGDFTGAPLNVTFTVTGMTAPLTDVRVSFTSGGLAHSWVGDLDVTLRAPADAAVKTIFKQTLGATATACGDDSDVAGPYNFFDTAPASPTWWAAATTATGAVPIASGDYQATTPGGAAGGGVVTPITPTFAGLSTGQINGTWTLRVHDGGQGDTGAISAASLTLVGGAAVVADGPLDYNGDGKTDFVVVRNTGGGPTGQVSFLYKLNGTSSFQGKFWGLATDFFISGNWDTDANDDIAVWRSGSAGTAAFYVLRSTDNTALIDFFGQTGDDPTVVDDYNGDGRTDFAVYRAGAASGDPSTWFWRSAATPGGAVNYVPWGQNGDFPAPGDYDGDGKADYVIQRNNGGGQARFWMSQTTAGFSSIVFGTPSDVIVPGDYDGDGKTDIAVVRGISGSINWFWHPSGGGADVQTVFGTSATDFPTQGDYDGDGKTDVSIWRPDADPTNCNFWSRNSVGAVSVVEFGQNGDYPVANYNTH